MSQFSFHRLANIRQVSNTSKEGFRDVEVDDGWLVGQQLTQRFEQFE